MIWHELTQKNSGAGGGPRTHKDFFPGFYSQPISVFAGVFP